MTAFFSGTSATAVSGTADRGVEAPSPVASTPAATTTGGAL